MIPLDHFRKDRGLLGGRTSGEYRRAAKQDRGEERSGEERLNRLLQDDDEVEKTPAAAAEFFRHDNTEPAEFSNFLPQLGGVRGLIRHHLAHERRWTFIVEKLRRRVTQRFLIFSKTEIHGSSLTKSAED